MLLVNTNRHVDKLRRQTCHWHPASARGDNRGCVWHRWLHNALNIGDKGQVTAILAEEGIGMTRITRLPSDRGTAAAYASFGFVNLYVPCGTSKGRHMKTSLVWVCHTHSDLFRPTLLWVGISIFLCPPRIARNFSGALDRVVRRLSFIDVRKTPAERKTFTYYATQSAVGLERIHLSANLI